MTWHWFFHPKTILFISKSPVYQGFNRYLTVKPHEIHHIHLKASALGRPSSKLQFEASFELIRDEAFVGHELPTISAISRNHQKSLRLWSQIDLSWRAFEGPLKGLWRACSGEGGVFSSTGNLRLWFIMGSMGSTPGRQEEDPEVSRFVDLPMVSQGHR